MSRSKALHIGTATSVVLAFTLGIFFLAQTLLPSADVIAGEAELRPVIKISDYDPGDVDIVLLNKLPVIIWRRDEADKKLAASQNTPEAWRYQSSPVFGQKDTVFADDANLTLGNEWFFALALDSYGFIVSYLRAGVFDGFLEGKYMSSYDLAGRIRIGAGDANLAIVRAEYTDDGLGIQLYLNGSP